MKAVIYKEYGNSEVLKFEEIDRPVPGESEVLIKVHSVSLNASDCEMLTGKPSYTRIWGLFKPTIGILGSDISGEVIATGKNVTLYNPGDMVLGDNFDKWGGLAEYVCVPEDRLILKPEDISHDVASALPQASVIALQGLRNIKRGDTVAINGAGGGAGTFAIQIAKYMGAEVTAIDSSIKLEMMSSLGADHVIDYTKEDFTASKDRYDLILDLVGYHSIFRFKRALKSGGIYYMVGGTVRQLLQTLITGSLISLLSKNKMSLLAIFTSQKDLGEIVNLIKKRTIKPVIDKVYKFGETPIAFNSLCNGLNIGKVVISLV